MCPLLPGWSGIAHIGKLCSMDLQRTLYFHPAPGLGKSPAPGKSGEGLAL